MYPTKKLWEICDIKTWKKDVNYAADDWEYQFFTCWREVLKSPWFSFDTDAILIAWNWDVWACKKFKWKFEAYQRTYVLDNFQNIEKNFLFYFLDWNLKKELLNETLWSAIPYIKLWSLQNREIPLPPLPIQQKIVFKLDSSFEKLDKAIILTRQNLASIEELNKSILEKIFKECEGKYEKKKIWEILDFIWSGFACNKLNETLDWYVHLRTHNIDTNWKLVFDTIIKINPEKVDFKKAKIKKWEILFNNTNSKELVWKTAYVEKDYDFWYSNHLTKLVVNNNNSARFITYFFNYLFFKNFFLNISNKWIGQAGVNNTMVQKIIIPLPPLPEQQKIVEYLDNIFAKNKILQEKYKQDLQNLEELKQSILKQAFEDEDFIK